MSIDGHVLGYQIRLWNRSINAVSSQRGHSTSPGKWHTKKLGTLSYWFHGRDAFANDAWTAAGAFATCAVTGSTSRSRLTETGEGGGTQLSLRGGAIGLLVLAKPARAGDRLIRRWPSVACPVLPPSLGAGTADPGARLLCIGANTASDGHERRSSGFHDIHGFHGTKGMRR
jgi:hypothetical protein